MCTYSNSTLSQVPVFLQASILRGILPRQSEEEAGNWFQCYQDDILEPTGGVHEPMGAQWLDAATAPLQIKTQSVLAVVSLSCLLDGSLCWNCFPSKIHNHLHKCFTLRGTKAQLLFFSSSVVQNPNAHPRPTSQDLAGFWDMLQLSIENISMKFDELHQLKANNWKQMDPHDKKVEHCRFCMLHLKPCTNTGQIK